MLLTFEAVSQKIQTGRLLHIAGSETLLRKLPKGNWIGGSTEYFMTEDGGKVAGDLAYVTTFQDRNYNIKPYAADEIENVANDAYDNGFSIVIIPFDSAVHEQYAEHAAEYENMFMCNITGWIAGMNLGKPGQVPISVNGLTGEVYTDKAVVLHLESPEGKTATMGIVNIFEQDEASPLIAFTQDGFVVNTCLVDGSEVVFADYITKQHLDTKMPIVGDYSGTGINVSIKKIENGLVHLYAPVFGGIQYRMAKKISNYEAEFRNRIEKLNPGDSVFSCNCILNFLYGELEGKRIESFAGPITFGEIAYQLLNQTLVYVIES